MSNIYQNKKHLPWVEKYRPSDIKNIISHDVIVTSLVKFIDMKTLPHLLFYGPSGTGKTSTIKCCAKKIYGQYLKCMVLELNASNDRGISAARVKIKNFVSNKNSIFLPKELQNVFKLVILDEIDSMTMDAQCVLRQIIEKNSASTRFCLICNDIDKINIALQSRCALYRFSPLSSNEMYQRLKEISQLENVKYDKSVLNDIVKISKGDMRTAINTLQHVNLTIEKKIVSKNVYQVSGFCMPKITMKIFNLLLELSKDEMSLQDGITQINDIVIDNNITVFNLLDELKNSVIEYKFSTKQKIFLIDNFAKNEVYDSVNVEPHYIVMIIASLFVQLLHIQ